MNTEKLLSITGLENRLRTLARQFESQHGIKEIIVFIESSFHRDDHVAKYRRFIRNHISEWRYCDDIANSFDCLYYRFVQTSLNYVSNAIQVFELLLDGSKDAKLKAFQIAFFSESARGREGKTSQIGLDLLQERLIDEMEGIVNLVWTPELGKADEVTNLLCQVLSSGHSSAAELKSLYSDYINVCNEELSLENIERVDNFTEGLASKLLREFSCYSITRFNRQLNLYRGKIINNLGELEKQREFKIQLTESIAGRLMKLGHKPEKFLKLILQIDTLNYCNDIIDVKYALKSWPGFIHWHVFSFIPDGDTLSNYSKSILN
jgi:hypothetical protein